MSPYQLELSWRTLNIVEMIGSLPKCNSAIRFLQAEGVVRVWRRKFKVIFMMKVEQSLPHGKTLFRELIKWFESERDGGDFQPFRELKTSWKISHQRSASRRRVDLSQLSGSNRL
ncbi:hypothetical protein AVEN_39245-1 [Araneus ventricosus]|uniref:Uncharacterized protein n=1 Tax=Araneus ventricosus TaxID=182803 RepID=A0A4Y2EQE2_ARAVE|nr:hypothetical protein AVEN_39245-1 [Araneus ventricosus]